MTPYCGTHISATTRRARSPSATREAAILEGVRTMLNRHPHFHGHAAEISVELDGCTLVLTGQLPSFYLKQLLQESLRALEGVAAIDNRVDVICCNGLSSLHGMSEGASCR